MLHLGVLTSGASSYGGAYANGYMAYSPNSLAVDSSGCIWATNFEATGGLSCVLSDGTQTDYTFGSTYLDAVALDSSETVHVVEGDTVYSYEPSTGASSAVFTADAAILDIVLDYNDDLYVETANDEVLLVEDGSSTVLGTAPQKTAHHEAWLLLSRSCCGRR